MAIEVCAFIGSSYIRQYAEDWTVERMLQNTREALTFAQQNNLPVMYVTEDTTRARPETIKALYTTAIELGARASASATPSATPRRRARAPWCASCANWPTSTTRRRHRLARPPRPRPRHRQLPRRDRSGRDRIHGTALGVGERAGNAPMDLLLVNCRCRAGSTTTCARCPTTCAAAKAIERDDPAQLPGVRRRRVRDRHRRARRGRHQGLQEGRRRARDRVYSGVPAAHGRPRAAHRRRPDGGQVERESSTAASPS
jgi:hypothetical protein